MFDELNFLLFIITIVIRDNLVLAGSTMDIKAFTL